MRNIAEYPITNGEILGAMDRAIIDSKVKNAGCIPDMTTLLLDIARGVVARGLRGTDPKPVERAHMHRRLDDGFSDKEAT